MIWIVDDDSTILKKLRSNPATRDIPIIMATAKGAEMDRITGLDTSADDYLVKPFGIMTLVSRIKAMLRRCCFLSVSNDFHSCAVAIFIHI